MITVPPVYILGLSLAIQMASIVIALRLISVTGWKSAWIFIAIGIVTMGFRRFMTFTHLVTGQPDIFSETLYYTLGLAGATAMLIGVMSIKPRLLAMQAVEKLQAEALRVKDMHMREVYHRVKNNLSVIQSLLSLQMRSITDSNQRVVLQEAQGRIKSMTMIHERLHGSDDLNNIGLREYIGTLAQSLFSTYQTGQNIRLNVDVHDARIDADSMIPLGLILNELVSNALKHAFADGRRGEIKVRFTKEGEGEYELAVRDNGRGLPAGFDQNHTKSLGMTIVRSLAGQLGGTLSISGNGGAEFRIRFREKLKLVDETPGHV